MAELLKGATSAEEYARWGYAKYFHLSKFYICFMCEFLCHVHLSLEIYNDVSKRMGFGEGIFW